MSKVAVITAAALCAAGMLLAPSAATAQPASVYEWGRPVANGGPGPTPTVVQAVNDVQIDAGNYTDVLVKPDGTVWGWGGASMTLEQVPGVFNVSQRPVDGNGSFTVLEQPGDDSACPASSSVVKWGQNTAPAVISQLECQNVVQLASAATHTFALTATGQVFVWGGGQNNVLGLGAGVTNENKPTPVPAVTALTGGTSVGVHITTGATASSLLVDGQAYGWGGDFHGQCGCGKTQTQVDSPQPVTQGSTVFVSVDMGGNLNGGTGNGHELALDTNGNVWAWGDNGQGQLGVGSRVDSNVPVEVSGLPAGIVDVRAGGAHSLALDEAGNVWAWGSNSNGQVGNGSNSAQTTPVEVLSGASQIAAGSLHSLAQ